MVDVQPDGIAIRAEGIRELHVVDVCVSVYRPAEEEGCMVLFQRLLARPRVVYEAEEQRKIFRNVAAAA